MKKTHPPVAAHILATCILLTTTSLPAPASASAGKSFSVKTYGAKGDGVTDDTNAILATLAAAKAAGTATVIFPNGLYAYSAALPVSGPISLVGPQDGLRGQKAVLLSTSEFANVRFQGNGCRAQGLGFNGTGRSKRAIHIEGASGCLISGCTFNAAFGNAIDVAGGNNNRVNDNIISTSSGTGILLTRTGCTVDSNQVFEQKGSGSRGIVIDSCVNANIVKNDFTNNNLGNDSIGILDKGSTSSQVVGNNVFGYDQCIRLAGDASPFVSMNQLNVQKGSIAIKAEAPNSATINQNTIDGPKLIGVEVIRSSGTVTITANTIRSCGTFGILASQVGNIDVDKNQLSNCGLSSSTRAVIDIFAPQAGSISIDKNFYTGNEKNLFLFILSKPVGLATASGNRTTTTLGSDF